MNHEPFILKPPFRAGPEPVRKFQQAAAGEELPRVGHIHIYSNARIGMGHDNSPTSTEGFDEAAQSAALKRDSR